MRRPLHHRTGVALPAGVLAGLFAGSVRAAGHGAGTEGVLATDRIGQVLVGLFVVLGAIVAAAWIGRRLMRIQPRGDEHLRLVGGLSLGPRERVVLIQAGETQLLVGVAPGRVQALHVLDQALPVDARPAGASQGAPFARVLERIGAGAGGRS